MCLERGGADRPRDRDRQTDTEMRCWGVGVYEKQQRLSRVEVAAGDCAVDCVRKGQEERQR